MSTVVVDTASKKRFRPGFSFSHLFSQLLALPRPSVHDRLVLCILLCRNCLISFFLFQHFFDYRIILHVCLSKKAIDLHKMLSLLTMFSFSASVVEKQGQYLLMLANKSHIVKSNE